MKYTTFFALFALAAAQPTKPRSDGNSRDTGLAAGPGGARSAFDGDFSIFDDGGVGRSDKKKAGVHALKESSKGKSFMDDSGMLPFEVRSKRKSYSSDSAPGGARGAFDEDFSIFDDQGFGRSDKKKAGVRALEESSKDKANSPDSAPGGARGAFDEDFSIFDDQGFGRSDKKKAGVRALEESSKDKANSPDSGHASAPGGARGAFDEDFSIFDDQGFGRSDKKKAPDIVIEDDIIGIRREFQG